MKLFKSTYLDQESAHPAERISRWAYFMDLVTFAHWPIVLGVGLAGFVFATGRPPLPIPSEKSTPLPPVELLEVNLVPNVVSTKQRQTTSRKNQTVAPPKVAAMQPLPEFKRVHVADASEVLFAMPVDVVEPVAEVAAASGIPAAQGALGVGSSLETTHLTFGYGEGAQPAPRYPFKAAKQGQEGRVGISFVVGENGRVMEAEVTSPCPWPLLNDEACQTVLNRWRFSKGTLRRYDVFIRFNLSD